MNLPVWAVTIFQNTAESIIYTGSSRLMQISLLRISLLRFFKTITVNFRFKHVRFKEVFRFKEEFHCSQNFST